jgi:hypothetical protein
MAGELPGSEELAQELLTNLTQTQLIYVLQRIQQLSTIAPDRAREILTEDPKLSLALLHAEFLAGARADKLLPLSADEVRLAKERHWQLRNPGGLSLSSTASSVAPLLAAAARANFAQKLAALDEGVLNVLTGSADVVDIDSLVGSLLKLGESEIARLPEEVQVILLEALQQ